MRRRRHGTPKGAGSAMLRVLKDLMPRPRREQRAGVHAQSALSDGSAREWPCGTYAEFLHGRRSGVASTTSPTTTPGPTPLTALPAASGARADIGCKGCALSAVARVHTGRARPLRTADGRPRPPGCRGATGSVHQKGGAGRSRDRRSRGSAVTGPLRRACRRCRSAAREAAVPRLPRTAGRPSGARPSAGPAQGR